VRVKLTFRTKAPMISASVQTCLVIPASIAGVTCSGYCVFGRSLEFMKCHLSTCRRYFSFSPKALVRRVKLRMALRTVGQRDLARHRPMAPADQPHVSDRVMGGATRPGRDQGHTVAREAGDALAVRRLDGLSQSHGWQHTVSRLRDTASS
jgi:hypothetical protein